MARVRYFLADRDPETGRRRVRELPTEEALHSEMLKICRWNTVALASGMPERAVDFNKLLLYDNGREAPERRGL